MNIRNNCEIKEKLKDNFNENDIEKIYKIFEENLLDNDNLPTGEIEIIFKGSRSRLGKTFLARCLFQKLKELGYIVNIVSCDKDGKTIDSLDLSTQLGNFVLNEVINTRANIIIKDISSF